MPHTLTVIVGETVQQIETTSENSLHASLAGITGTGFEAPCGGKGKCGKCKLIIEKGLVTEVTEQERKLLSASELERGVRLACLTFPKGDVRVMIREASVANILVAGVEYDADVLPQVRKSFIQIPEPSLSDQRDDFARLAAEMEGDEYRIPLSELIRLPELLRSADSQITVIHDNEWIISIEPGDTTDKNYGIAVDIGTTTVVAYLVDLTSGKTIDAASGLSAQKPYGQDVISRINYTIENEGGVGELGEKIVEQINSLIRELAERNNISMDTIYSISLAGNTTMIHMAARLPARYMANAPFIPVVKSRMTFTANELGFSIPKGANVYLLPAISAYVGADIVAAILSSGLFYGEALSLLIDIGTNGEIALGNRDRLLCCSTAAGPAFEGATIRHGMGGVNGAISAVKLEKQKISYTTIGDAPAAGICGSGIVDAVALLLECGVLDETGRMLAGSDLPEGTECKLESHIVEDDGEPAIAITEDILLIQKDVREVQLAKASIAAGIMTLLSAAEKEAADIDVVYLAGGFGSFIDKDNAIRIGLIPAELRDKIQVIGNAAGTGAVQSLVSKECLAECDRIAAKAEYIELSTSQEFQDHYIDSMFFPDK